MAIGNLELSCPTPRGFCRSREVSMPHPYGVWHARPWDDQQGQEPVSFVHLAFNKAAF